MDGMEKLEREINEIFKKEMDTTANPGRKDLYFPPMYNPSHIYTSDAADEENQV